MLNRVWRYWHTVRYLKSVQIYGRVAYRLRRGRVDLRPRPTLRRLGAAKWMRPASREQNVLPGGALRFLNETRRLDDIGWDDPAVDKLWRYNLHYFDDLCAERAGSRSAEHRALMERWIRENQPASGTGWEAYPTSLRIVNWIKYALAGNDLSERALQSLSIQVRFLSTRLERHILGNHLFVNAKALVFAGLFFQGEEADAWLDCGFNILAREIPEQILADGGQFERSPMYHALALEDVADLLNITRVFADAIPTAGRAVVAQLSGRVQGMRYWLACMCHPDGQISFFNDSAMAIALEFADLERYVAELGCGRMEGLACGVHFLAESGYVRVEGATFAAILDVAPVGPDYLPAHAHADTLSFELSLFGERVFVNCGTSRYGTSAQRLIERSTTAHNTVVIDGEDSSEVWGGFRVARRARPIGVEISEIDGSPVIRASHDGYMRLPGEAVHSRMWRFTESGLTIVDDITGRFSNADARFHLHPAVTIEAGSFDSDSPACTLVLADGQRLTLTLEGAVLRQEKSSWHPQFGVSEPTTCLVAEFLAPRCITRVEWVNVR